MQAFCSTAFMHCPICVHKQTGQRLRLHDLCAQANRAKTLAARSVCTSKQGRDIGCVVQAQCNAGLSALPDLCSQANVAETLLTSRITCFHFLMHCLVCILRQTWQRCCSRHALHAFTSSCTVSCAYSGKRGRDVAYVTHYMLSLPHALPRVHTQANVAETLLTSCITCFHFLMHCLVCILRQTWQRRCSRHALHAFTSSCTVSCAYSGKRGKRGRDVAHVSHYMLSLPHALSRVHTQANVAETLLTSCKRMEHLPEIVAQVAILAQEKYKYPMLVRVYFEWGGSVS